MKLSHILIASAVCMIAAFSGCGGSGTPLPAQKTAKVTFIARTSAAQTLKGTNRINDYTVAGFVTPTNLSAPVIQGEKTILSDYINGYKGAAVLGSYSTNALTQPAPGKIKYSTLVTNTSSDIGFGPIADLYLVMGDQTLSKGTITSLITTANPTMKAIAALCPPNAACALNPTKIDVFYNISVSVQNR